ncbi:hypothetical protein PHMEG_00013098 [Phytophthora megakarya]|uniref:Uncharacterized protein n=1 Tax=Phytophthora megakarya TaxID=4795 RepID=A0A225W8S3_9STRA|nr:hypothetical protein PHMEG_00013098 [Phytophthora megakarya]
MKALLAENASLHRANSVLRQNSAEHGLNTDALILSTVGLSASGRDWELLGLGPDHTGLLRLMPLSSQSEGSVGEDSEPPVAEVSESPSKASLGSGSLNEESAEHFLSAPAPKEHSPPLDFAFLALMHNVRSSRHPWLVLFDRMPSEPLTFSLGTFVKGVRISIRASGLGGLVRMWPRFSGHCYEDNEKVDLCVALWEHRHWLQISSMDNAIQAFRKTSDPRDPFTRVVLSLWADHNRTRNNRADLLRQQFDRLWDWCSKANGDSGDLPTEVLLEPSYLQYSMEVLEWAPATEDLSRELRVLDAEQPWRNRWIDAPAEHPYNTTYAPCNPSAPLFVPTSMTRQAVISSIVVDNSLAGADLTAPWVTTAPSVAEISEGLPAKTVEEGSVGIEGASSAPVETVEALDEDPFSFAPAEAAASGSDSAAAESSATPTGVEAPDHDVEEPPSDIVLAPFEMLVQIATSERLASE